VIKSLALKLTNVNAILIKKGEFEIPEEITNERFQKKFDDEIPVDQI
jgi:hypothetical protein